MAQLAEHVIGNDEVPGPNPGSSSKKSKSLGTWIFLSKPIGLVYHHPAMAVYHLPAKAVYIAALARRISSKKRVPKHPPFYLWISILCVNNL